jgi:APA family basic amino acid/polyamine antiporter
MVGQPGRPQLRRALGLREAVALGIGGTIGGGIFVLIGPATAMAGPGVLVSFLIGFLAALAIALPYAELACRYPLAGGGYAFTKEVLGRRFGFFMGWEYWGAYVFASGYVVLGFGGYLHLLIGAPVVISALALIGFTAATNVLGVKVAGGVQAAIVVLELVALLVFGLTGLPHIQSHNFYPFFPSAWFGVLGAALLAFLAFGGFDMVAAAGEEVSRPEVNLPLAIVLTLAAVLGVYLLVAVVVVGVMPAAQLNKMAAPLAEVAAHTEGSAGRNLIATTALLTTAATANAVVLVTSRIAFAMARDGLLPVFLSRVHSRTHVPWAAILASAGLLSLVALTGSVTLAAAVGGFLYVLHFVLPLVALVVVRRTPAARPVFSTPLPKLVIPVAFLSAAALLAASGVRGVVLGLAWIAGGQLLFLLMTLTRRTRRRPLASHPSA